MLPQTYFHGKTYPDTVTYNDSVLLGLVGSTTHKPKEIHIFHDNKYVYGLEVIYSDKSKSVTDISSGPHKGSEAGFFTSTSKLVLDDDEYIIEVGGGAGAWMDRIHFVTNKMRKESYGGPGGDEFWLSAPIQHHFATFTVGIGGHLHNIEVKLAPIPSGLVLDFGGKQPSNVNTCLPGKGLPPAGGYTNLPGQGEQPVPAGGFTSLPGAGGPPAGGYTSLPGAGGPPPGGYSSLPGSGLN
eukprot:TRINITY_DN12873_c0_g1_i2.p1 TRINITY_DN12873_c0_g1~~TRINITY_DN12873_c0_g1_i2.p1  ORF type:complete len:240 (-),score=36.07 TRINITY_DN12873_c0_g1_i2:120-839(-)